MNRFTGIVLVVVSFGAAACQPTSSQRVTGPGTSDSAPVPCSSNLDCAFLHLGVCHFEQPSDDSGVCQESTGSGTDGAAIAPTTDGSQPWYATDGG